MLGPIGRQANLVDYLIRQTEGNVFFLIEIVRSLAEDAGELQRIDHRELPEQMLTVGMERIVEQRIARVPQSYQALLDFSAVLGRQLDMAVLGQQFQAVRLRDFLMTCANATVLESQGSTWRFAHDKLRESILQRQTKAVRITLHRQVAEALENVYQGAAREAQSAALARHFQEAGIPEKALPYHLLAGEGAIKLYAYVQAYSHFINAEQVLLGLPDKMDM